MSDAEPREITLQAMRKHFYSAVVCDVLDAVGRRNQSPRVPLPPLTTDGVLVGRARTTLWVDMAHEDSKPYELELRAVDGCQPDDILVAAAGGSLRSGVWGELLTTAVRNRGCVGAVVDGASRDIRQIRAIGFPVFARGVSPYDSKDRQRVVDLDVTVEIGGVAVSSGDLIVADEDGVVVVPQALEADVVRRAWTKVHSENEVRDAIRGGMSATEAFATYGVL